MKEWILTIKFKFLFSFLICKMETYYLSYSVIVRIMEIMKKNTEHNTRT